MQIISKLEEFNIKEKTAVAIGKFDGIHLGHKELLSRITDKKKDGLKSVIFTFDPSPEEFFMGHQMPQLFTQIEKRLAFERMGIDILVEFPLNEVTAATHPEDFVRRILVKELGACFIAAGSDVSFGDKGKGDSALLERLSGELGYELCIIDKVRVDDEEVSSTRVRNAVADGEMLLTERLLGDKYSVCGIVEHGRHIGRTIGVPTVNIIPEEYKLLPPYGVYSSIVVIDGKEYKGMTNIGRKPTISEKEKVGVETYIYDFKEDVYDKFIEVKLGAFVRPEMKFDSIDALKAQIKLDIKNSYEP
ncbi:MAG: bifunctional riboflavin kinase/FAD synthetase [Butyrivibrio sp.]|nr:bifunctional riboflavin kinase/FAD synthetase [Butyrivibrio sp.]